MKISIIIATKNCKNLLKRCLLSIVNQSKFENIEILIADSNSIDGTIEVINEFSKSIYWYKSENDNGIADAWNKAIKYANGNWIYFMGADDRLYENETIEKILPILNNVEKDKEIAIFSVYQSNPLNALKSKFLEAFWDREYHYKVGMNLSHQGIFHRKSIFENGILFNTNLKLASDYELLLRVLINSEPFVYKQLVCSNQEIGGLSSRFDLNYVSYLEFSKARQINNINNFSFLYYYYLLRSYAKNILYSLLFQKNR